MQQLLLPDWLLSLMYKDEEFQILMGSYIQMLSEVSNELNKFITDL